MTTFEAQESPLALATLPENTLGKNSKNTRSRSQNGVKRGNQRFVPAESIPRAKTDQDLTSTLLQKSRKGSDRIRVREDILDLDAIPPLDIDQSQDTIALEDPEEPVAFTPEEDLMAEVALQETLEASPNDSDDTYNTDPEVAFKKGIPKGPLLTAEEEITLGRLVQAGKRAEAQLATSSLPPSLQHTLEKAVIEGNKARKKLVERNLRLVVNVAHKYRNRGLPMEDLLQEGSIGVRRGADKYDPERGFRFSTYAYWWIRQAVTRALAEQARIIRLPVQVIQDISRLSRFTRQLEQDLGRQPTPQELADGLGISREKLVDLLEANTKVTSLSQPLGDEDEQSLGDTIAADESSDPGLLAGTNMLSDQVWSLMKDRLDDRHRNVIVLRFGLDRGGHQRTLAEVGDIMQVSRERVRQIEGVALRRLKGNAADTIKHYNLEL
jgi:RNA polymerase primary sigma factor